MSLASKMREKKALILLDLHTFFLCFLISKHPGFERLELQIAVNERKHLTSARVCVCLLADYPPPPPPVEDAAPLPTSSSFPPPPTNSYDFQVRERVFYLLKNLQFDTSSRSICLSTRLSGLICGGVPRRTWLSMLRGARNTTNARTTQ